MKLEVGKAYKTRSGQRVDVTSIDTDSKYPVNAFVVSLDGRIRTFISMTEDGRWYTDVSSDYDIVSEWYDNVEIEVGKYYRTKNGNKARIYATDGGFGKKIHGAFLRSDGAWIPEWWLKDGKCMNNTWLDLIAEWTEPIDFDPSCLPSWATWIAMARSGNWVWFTSVPHMLDGDWDYTYCRFIPKKYSPKNFTGSWEESAFEVNQLK